jgi:hypothetical protein
MFKITLRDGHPQKQFRRGGRLFMAGEPVVLAELNGALRRELAKPGSWLVCEELAEGRVKGEETAPPAPAAPIPPIPQLLRLTREQLLDLCRQQGMDISGKPLKSHLIGWLEQKAGRP